MSPVAGSGMATAITVFHRPHDPQQFDEWAGDYLASARRADGHVGSRVSVHASGLNSGIEATFAGPDHLDAWLDSPERAAVLQTGAARGFLRSSGDIVIVGADVPEALSVFMHSVSPGKEADFIAAQCALSVETGRAPGSEGTVVFPPGAVGEWRSVLRFRTGRQLTAWLNSHEREAALPALRAHLTSDFSELPRSAAFGSTVRTDHGRTRITPRWKSTMVVLLCLYPTVMLLTRFLVPALGELGMARWHAIFVSNATSVALLSWLLVPAASRMFRRWLDPVDGAGWRFSLAGAGVIVACYAVIILIFGWISWLHF